MRVYSASPPPGSGRALNPSIPATVLETALEQVLDRRPALSLAAAIHEIHQLPRDGILVEFDDSHGQRQQESR